MSNYEFDVYHQSNQNVIVFSKAYFNYILKQKNWPDLHALYSFYYFCKHWQNDDTVWANNSYASEGLGWSREKVSRIRTKLKEIHLIDFIQEFKDDGKFGRQLVELKVPRNISFTAATKDGFRETQALISNTNTKKRIINNSLNKEKQNKKINKKENFDTILPSEYFEFAFQLSNIITDRYDIRIPHSEIKEWERHFKLLIEKDGATPKAVSETLEFYSKKIGEEYIPNANTGKDFRAKFIKLQEAMKRTVTARKRTVPSNMYQSTPETMKRIFEEVKSKTTIR